MNNDFEFAEFGEELKNIDIYITKQTIEETKKLLISLHDKYKKMLNTVYLLYDGTNKNIQQHIILNIDTQLDNIRINIKNNRYIDCQYEINAASKKIIEEHILLAGWHGTAFSLNREIQQYIIQKNNITNTQIINELKNYYFNPTYADVRFKNIVLENIKNIIPSIS